MKFTLLMLLCLLLWNCKNETNEKDEKNPKNIPIKEWLIDSEIYFDIINMDNKCPIIDQIHELKFDEFKAPLYKYLAECYLNKNNDSVKYYLLKSVENGYHPDRIDRQIFNDYLEELKADIKKKHHLFWSKIDTSYFSPFEIAVQKDQAIRRKAIEQETKENLTKLSKIDSANQVLLDNYIKEKGHFPKTYHPSYFKNFRTDVKPKLIAGHAKDKDKLRYLDLSISDAQKGLISWFNPIRISNLLLISGISTKEHYPFWLSQFNESNKLIRNDKTYLEFYSIYKMFLENSEKNITLRYSKYGDNPNMTGLKNLKDYFLKNFNISEDRVIIDDSFLDNEINYQNVRDYNYIFHITN